MTRQSSRARIVFLIKVRAERTVEFLQAYEYIRYTVAEGVPGHLVDQVCRSSTDPEQWLITSEWASLQDFVNWESSDDHRTLVAPMRACMSEARSMRFEIQTETSARTAATPAGGLAWTS
jgi:heme oxygenase (mycobilin-producing)